MTVKIVGYDPDGDIQGHTQGARCVNSFGHSWDERQDGDLFWSFNLRTLIAHHVRKVDTGEELRLTHKIEATPTFEAGKFYRTRDGRKAVCLMTDRKHETYTLRFATMDDAGFTYSTTPAGQRFETREAPEDLLREWVDGENVEPEEDTSEIHTHLRDAMGTVFKTRGGEWVHHIADLGDVYDPPEDSLCRKVRYLTGANFGKTNVVRTDGKAHADGSTCPDDLVEVISGLDIDSEYGEDD